MSTLNKANLSLGWGALEKVTGTTWYTTITPRAKVRSERDWLKENISISQKVIVEKQEVVGILTCLSESDDMLAFIVLVRASWSRVNH